MLVQLEDFCDGFDDSMRKLNRKVKNRLLGFGIPFLTGCVLAATTQNMYFLVGGTAIFSTGAMICSIKDDIKEYKKRANKPLLPPTEQESPFKKKEFDISEPIMRKNANDFYTDYAKEWIENSSPSKEEQSAEQPLEELVLGKEETMEQIVYEYDIYRKLYKLPEMSIKNREWDILFDTIYEALAEQQAENKFYKYMSFLNRYVLAASLVHQEKRITIYSYMGELSMLTKVGYQEINAKTLRKQIRDKLGATPIIKLDPNAFRLKK